MFNFNVATTEVIALLADSEPEATTALVRRADGQISLETIVPDSKFARDAMTTGCFRKGKPIIDPVSREIMGYEMEMVARALAFMR